MLSKMSDVDSSPECCFGKSYGNHENNLPYDTCLTSILRDRFLCDLLIRVGNDTRPAHRIILSAASSFFRELLKDTKLPGQESESELDLTSVFTEARNLDDILMYIYGGHLTLTETSVKALLQVNNVLAMPALDNQCAQFLLTNLRPVNCLQTWETAWKYNLQELFNISLIVCRETLYDLLIINDYIVNLSDGFISEFVANEEVLITMKPNSIVRMLLWWTHAQPIAGKNKKGKFLSLLDAYLKWKTLSEIELESISLTIGRCSDEFPEMADDIVSWLMDRYNAKKSIQPFLPKTDDAETSENSDNSDLVHYQDWSLLVSEKDCRTVGIYCNTKSKWFTMDLQDSIFKTLGFIDNCVVLERKSNTLFLKNVSTMTLWTLSSPIYNTPGIEKCPGAYDTTFFLHLNNIYSVDAITNVDSMDLVFLLNRWDHEEQCWKFVLHLTPKIVCNDFHSISLKVDTSNGDSVYLFLTVKLTPDSRQSARFNPQPDEYNTCESSASGFSGNPATTLGEKTPSVCMKPLEMFYVYQINMKDYTYQQIAKRRCEPAILSTNRKIILDDKILFFLDPDPEIESQFRYAFYYKNDCFLNCLSLCLKDGSWANMTLRVPLPNIRDISIKKRDHACFDSFVTSCKNLLFVGTHWSPHVFQVIMYDISNLTINVLPSIPLPAIRQMSIFALHAHQPISDILTEEIRTVDLLNFHFKDWSLLSWQGTLS